VELEANVRIKLDPKQKHRIDVVVDRLVIDDRVRVRLSDSVETALKWGEGTVMVLHQPPDIASPTLWHEALHSNRMYSPATGQSFDRLTPKHFSFNSPAGACPVCHGLGQKLVFDEDLIVPDKEKSLEQGAVLPWRRGGKRMVSYKSLLQGLATHHGQSLDTSYKDLPDAFQRMLIWGSGEAEIDFGFWRGGK
jgi:excinuclease ABC subunit A